MGERCSRSRTSSCISTPSRSRRRVLRLRYSFRLGFISAVLFGILILTGVYLMFFYTPAGRLGLRRHAGAAHRRGLRPARAQRAPLVGPSHGARGVPAHGAGVLRRRLQEAQGVQLGDRRRAAAAHPRAVVHGLPAALGPAQLLGGHGRHEPRPLRALLRQPASGPAHRRRPDRPGHAAALLRAPRGGPPVAVVLALCIHIWRVRKDGFAVERSSSVGAFAEEATELARRPPASVCCSTGAGGPLRRPHAGAGRRRPRVGHRRGTARRRHGVHLAAPHRAPRRRRARRRRRGARPRRGRSRRRCAGWRTRTSRPSRPRRRGTSPACRSCWPTSTRSWPASSCPTAAVLDPRAAALHRPQPGHRGAPPQGGDRHLQRPAGARRRPRPSSARSSAGRAGSSSRRGPTGTSSSRRHRCP